jgi:ABC-type lipoprotein release transport system permease subunit
VAGSLQYEEYGEETAASRYQVHVPYAVAAWRSTALMLRASGDPAELAPAVRAAFAELDPTLAMWDVRTMAEVRRYTTWGQRILGEIFGYFAVLALLLGAVGVYGVMAYAVSQRSREIGIRMALGADRRGVVRLVVRGGLAVAAIGLALGLAGSWAVGPLVAQLLWGVSPTDPRILAFVALTLAAVAVLASYLPARRASRVEPTRALRAE